MAAVHTDAYDRLRTHSHSRSGRKFRLYVKDCSLRTGGSVRYNTHGASQPQQDGVKYRRCAASTHGKSRLSDRPWE